VELEAGDYQLIIRMSGFEDMRETVTVLADETVRVEWLAPRVVQAAPVQQPPRQTPRQQPRPAQQPASTKGELRLRLRPPGMLSIDGTEIGEYNSYRDSLPAGQHLIQVRRDGYAPVDTSITIVAGKPLNVRIDLREN